MRSAGRAFILAVLVATSAAAQDAPAPDTPPPDVPTPDVPTPDVKDRIAMLERELEAQRRRLDEQARELEALAKRQTPPLAASETGGDDLRLSWDEGVVVSGRVKDVKVTLRPRGALQLDYRLFPARDQAPSDQFVIRRVGIGFEATFGDFLAVLVLQPLRRDLPLVDFFLQYQPIDPFKVRVGHFKAPFSMDNGITGDFRVDTVEHPIVLGSGSGVAPDFRPGVEVLGSFKEGLLQYWLAVQNQPDSNTVLSSDPLFTARLETAVGGFNLGAAAAFEHRAGVQSGFTGLTPGQFRFFAPVSVRGFAQRYVADASFYKGPFGVRAAWVWSSQRRRNVLSDGRDGASLVTQGAYATFTWVFFGPTAGSDRPHLVPFEGWQLFSFDIEKRRNLRDVGLELVCRVEWCDLDDGGGRRGAQGPSTAANAADVRGNSVFAVTTGLNLSPIENVKLMVDWVHLHFEDGTRSERRHTRHADELLFRAQLDF